MEKVINHFLITVVLESGEVWETIRHTREGLEKVVNDLVSDHDVSSFSVEEVM